VSRAWRLARRPFADLSGEGARQVGGRWNSPGIPMVYMAADPSLALLEVRARLDLPFELLPADYVFMEIDISGLAVEDRTLPADLADCRQLGDEWLGAGRTPLLRVPSVIVPLARNILLNPRHPASASAAVVALHPCAFDPRLWIR
jgi:RES domain-containing protein